MSAVQEDVLFQREDDILPRPEEPVIESRNYLIFVIGDLKLGVEYMICKGTPTSMAVGTSPMIRPTTKEATRGLPNVYQPMVLPTMEPMAPRYTNSAIKMI